MVDVVISLFLCCIVLYVFGCFVRLSFYRWFFIYRVVCLVLHVCLDRLVFMYALRPFVRYFGFLYFMFVISFFM